jgi:hypothetical protein
MKNSLKTKFLALSITALFAAQPATGNINSFVKSYTNSSIIQKAALPLALVGLGYYAQKSFNHVYSTYLLKDDQNNANNSYSEAINEVRKVPVNLMGDLALQKYGYFNKFQKTAFTKGTDICKSVNTIYNACKMPEFSLDTAKQSLELTLLATAGVFSGWFSKRLDGTPYESLEDCLALPVANGLLRKIYNVIGAKWHTQKSTGDAVLKLSQTGTKLFKAW